jgi:hypothetical protein
MRKFVDEVIYPDAQAREDDGKRASMDVLNAMAYAKMLFHRWYRLKLMRNRQVNLNAMRLGPGKHLQGRTLMDGIVKPEEFDYFQWDSYVMYLRLSWPRMSELVVNQELARIGARGYGDGLNAGMVIGLPPVMNFAKEPLRTKVLEEVFSGKRVSHASLRLTRRIGADAVLVYLSGHLGGVCGVGRGGSENDGCQERGWKELVRMVNSYIDHVWWRDQDDQRDQEVDLWRHAFWLLRMFPFSTTQ